MSVRNSKLLSDSRPRNEDIEKVIACLDGDKSAFRFLFEKYRERIYNIVYRFVNNREDALDLVQDTFIKAYQSLGSFRGRSSFFTWLCRIAMNTCIDFRRSRKGKEVVNLDEDMLGDDLSRFGPRVAASPDPVAELQRKELREQIDRAVESLPPHHKSVFVLRVIEDLSYKEIAEILDISIGTVMSRLHYARKRMQQALAYHVEAG